MTDALFPLVVVHCFWGWCGRGDMLIQPAQFRDAYPDKPALWALDRNRQEAAP